MIKNLSRILAIQTVCVLYLFATGYAGDRGEAVRIAILPCSDAVRTFKKFSPLATYLKEETGFDIKIVVPKDYAGFEGAIKTGNIDFAFQGPHTYVRLSERYNKDALIKAIARDGTTSQSGVFIARKDSDINKVENLGGKSVMFGPVLSATKWLAAKLLLEENGMDIDEDLLVYSNGGCCEDIAFNVYLKTVDAGVVCDHFMEAGEQIVIVGKTKSVPTRVFTAAAGVGNDIVTAVNQALLRLDMKEPAHKEILYHAELYGFQESKDEDYDYMRMLMGTGTAR
jgi:phosphonate transport system substrate-binding protein